MKTSKKKKAELAAINEDLAKLKFHPAYGVYSSDDIDKAIAESRTNPFMLLAPSLMLIVNKLQAGVIFSFSQELKQLIEYAREAGKGSARENS